MQEANYSVKTPVFEGPLDLLLDLIEKRKLFVSDISLSAVTDDFVRYIETHEEFPLGESAEFIVVASTLMLIKSRSLLPSLPLTEEEEASIEDLEERLRIYARVKELAAELKKLYGKHIIFEKASSKRVTAIFSPDSKTDVAHLEAALLAVLEALPKKELVPRATVQKVVTLEETIAKLSERISQSMKMNFSDFTGKDRVSVIVGFLAMLELVKRGVIRASQEGSGEISMETEVVGVPQYT